MLKQNNAKNIKTVTLTKCYELIKATRSVKRSIYVYTYAKSAVRECVCL